MTENGFLKRPYTPSDDSLQVIDETRREIQRVFVESPTAKKRRARIEAINARLHGKSRPSCDTSNSGLDK